MSYKSQKGYEGQYEYRDIINEAVEEYGYRSESLNGSEKNKKWLFGDCPIVNDKDKNCVLSDYFLEAKKHGKPQVWEVTKEAEENSKTYNKFGSIIYINKQAKGERSGRGGNRDKIIVMKPKTFIKLINELQGLREELRVVDN